MRSALLLSFLACCASAEIHNLSARQTLELALKQSPEVLMARLEAQKAAAAVRIARDPFTPKLFAGSGLAYTTGFPMSIEGSAPSVLQARAIQSLFNRPLGYQVAAARENARGVAIDADLRREEVAGRVLTLHLASTRAGRILELARQQIPSLESIAAAVQARVSEGRELPVEARSAELKVAQARQRVRALEAERDQLESLLAVTLGFPPEDRVHPVETEPVLWVTPPTEAAAVEEALANSKLLRRLESALQATQLEARGAHAARYPQVDLVAQYALMARFNNYEEFFRRFQRNNWQLGMSFQIPIFPGGAVAARRTQAEVELERLRTEVNGTRNRIAVNTRKSWQDLQVAESAREIARLDLDVARERLSVALAQFEEGRVPLRQVEELRALESDKWVAFYEAQHQVSQARLELLKSTGALLALLRQD